MSTDQPAGWYDDPEDPRVRRFWDGDEWTALVASGEGSGPPEAVVAPSTQHPPAGWYSDPADDTRRRYWDGETWTNRVLTRTTSSASPIVVEPGPSSSTPSPGAPDARTPVAGVPRRARPESLLVTGGPEALAPSVTEGAVAADTAAIATAVEDQVVVEQDPVAAVEDPVVAEEEEPAPPHRRRRTVVLALALLVALGGMVAVTVAGPGDEPARPEVTPTTVSPEVASPTTALAPETTEVIDEVDVDAVYEACQDLVKASPLSEDVRLVFQPVEDIVVARAGDSSLFEFWSRKRGDRSVDERVAFVCVAGDRDPDAPRVFMQI